MSELYRGRNEDRDRVRDASDIARIVGEHVALKSRGREYIGLCPFHDDHNPSMCVVPGKQIFHCFVCGAGGDVFTFIQKFHKMEFREALEHLAEKAGIQLTPLGTGEPESGATVGRADLVRANATAADFFRAVLSHPEHGRAGRDLIHRRGISPEMVEQFRIGVSPDRWDGLVLTIKSKGLATAPFAEAGLLKRRDGGDGFYDAMRNRLIFPIADQIGRVIAFGGRRLNDADDPKYLNSPETRLFKKSGTLFALDHASREIQRQRCAIIVEGYTDAIACHQAGFTNVVATLGTALTPDHAAVLRRLCDRVVMLFDGDDAGQRAADRTVGVLFAEPLDVKIATLAAHTDAKDPDELLKRENGAEVFRQALASAPDLLAYRFGRLRRALAGAGIAALSKAIEEEVANLWEWGLRWVEPIRQRMLLGQVASLAGIDLGTLLKSLQAGRSAKTRPEQRQGTIARQVRTAPEILLGCVLCDGGLWRSLGDAERDLVAPPVYGSTLLARVAQAVQSVARAGGTPDLMGVMSEIEDPEAQGEAVGIHEEVHRVTDGNAERLHEMFKDCVRRAGEPASGDRAGAEADLESKLTMIRERHAATGGNRRALPRAGNGN